MRNNQDQSREPSADQPEAPGHTKDLAERINTRYASSPGVIDMGGGGSGLAGQLYRFADRLPLLQSVQQRWSLDGGFPIPANPVWLRTLAPQQATGRPATVARVIAPASAKPVTAHAKPVAASDATKAHDLSDPPDPPNVTSSNVTSANVSSSGGTGDTGVLARSVDAEPTAGTERGGNASYAAGAVPYFPTAHGEPSHIAPGTHLQRRTEGNAGAESKAPGAILGASAGRTLDAMVAADASSSLKVSQSARPAPAQPVPQAVKVQMGPPIFKRPGKGTSATVNRREMPAAANTVPAKNLPGSAPSARQVTGPVHEPALSDRLQAQPVPSIALIPVPTQRPGAGAGLGLSAGAAVHLARSAATGEAAQTAKAVVQGNDVGQQVTRPNDASAVGNARGGINAAADAEAGLAREKLSAAIPVAHQAEHIRRSAESEGSGALTAQPATMQPATKQPSFAGHVSPAAAPLIQRKPSTQPPPGGTSGQYAGALPGGAALVNTSVAESPASSPQQARGAQRLPTPLEISANAIGNAPVSRLAIGTGVADPSQTLPGSDTAITYARPADPAAQPGESHNSVSVRSSVIPGANPPWHPPANTHSIQSHPANSGSLQRHADHSFTHAKPAAAEAAVSSAAGGSNAVSAMPETRAARNSPVATYSYPSQHPGEIALQRHPSITPAQSEDRIVDPAKAIVVHPHTAATISPAVFAMRIQPHVPPAAAAQQVSAARQASSSSSAFVAGDKDHAVPRVEAPPTMHAASPTPASPTSVRDLVLKHSLGSLPPAEAGEQMVSPRAATTNPVLRRTSLPSGQPSSANATLTASQQRTQSKSLEITHRFVRPTDEFSRHNLAQGATAARPGGGGLQRSPLSPAASSASSPAASPAPPSLPSAGSRAPQGMPSQELTQLANRVYDLLVRRLALEKQRKGA